VNAFFNWLGFYNGKFKSFDFGGRQRLAPEWIF